MPQVAVLHVDWLLAEPLHDLLDARQVRAADQEAAAAGPHVVAHLTHLAGGIVALGPHRDPVLPRVQQPPVVSVRRCNWKVSLTTALW